jgi:hypothetical protein
MEHETNRFKYFLVGWSEQPSAGPPHEGCVSDSDSDSDIDPRKINDDVFIVLGNCDTRELHPFPCTWGNRTPINVLHNRYGPFVPLTANPNTILRLEGTPTEGFYAMVQFDDPNNIFRKRRLRLTEIELTVEGFVFAITREPVIH